MSLIYVKNPLDNLSQANCSVELTVGSWSPVSGKDAHPIYSHSIQNKIPVNGFYNGELPHQMFPHSTTTASVHHYGMNEDNDTHSTFSCTNTSGFLVGSQNFLATTLAPLFPSPYTSPTSSPLTNNSCDSEISAVREDRMRGGRSRRGRSSYTSSSNSLPSELDSASVTNAKHFITPNNLNRTTSFCDRAFNSSGTLEQLDRPPKQQTLVSTSSISRTNLTDSASLFSPQSLNPIAESRFDLSR